jgi:hypothetical protein
MRSSGMLRRVALVLTYVTEEISTSIIKVTRIGELGATLAVTSNRCTLRRNTNCTVFLHSVHRLLLTANVVLSSPTLVTLIMEAPSSSETSVLTRATRCNIPKDIRRYSLPCLQRGDHSLLPVRCCSLCYLLSTTPNCLLSRSICGRAMPWLQNAFRTKALRGALPRPGRLFAGFSQRRPGFETGSSHMRNLWSTEQQWCKFPPSISVSLASH